VQNNKLTGYTVRRDLMEKICVGNTSKEFVFGSKFSKKEMCFLKNDPLPELENSHFNLDVREID
jgi:hypothetical protein